jgi:hypothetical protein
MFCYHVLEGADPAVFQEHIYLVMEWQNNPRKSHCVSVREKERTVRT